MGNSIPASIDELFLNRRAYFAFNTRTAIRSACDLLDLMPGDEILVPDYNCGSEIDPLRHAGLRVTLYPVGRDLVADPAAIASLVSPRTRAIYVTHYFGFLQPQLAQIRVLCDTRGLRLLEDCALSLLSGQTPAEGRIGDVAFFCLHKFFPVLGGGVLVVNDKDLQKDPRFDRPAQRRAEAKFATRHALATVLGRNRMRQIKRTLMGKPDTPVFQTPSVEIDIPEHYYFDPDLIGRKISHLTVRLLHGAKLSDSILQRRANWQAYHELLAQIPAAKPLISTLPDFVCPHSMPVQIPNRDRIAFELQNDGIDVTAWWAGFHQGLDWATAGEDAKRMKHNVLSLPLSPSLTRDEIIRIADHLAVRLGA